MRINGKYSRDMRANAFKKQGLGTAALVLSVAIILVSCSKKSSDVKAKPTPPPAPVLTTTVIEKDVQVELRAVGAVEAYATVAIKSQVSGSIKKIHFVEGTDVKKGDLLITIDPRPYQAALSQARAVLARDAAQLENARQIADRDEQLLQNNLVSQEEYDKTRANAKALAATVEADKAAVRSARLQLDYCYIHAPINGRAGSILMHEGNLVGPTSSQPIVVLNQIKPIQVNFAVPAQYLNEITNRMGAEKLSVRVEMSGDTVTMENGTLTFIDNSVDEATGTIRLKATFENEDNKLWPGAFVNVTLNLSTIPRAVVAPTQAIMTGQNGMYVFVLKDDMTAEMRPVTIKYEINGESVVETGLKAGDTIVLDGQMRIVPGAKVAPKNPSDGK